MKLMELIQVRSFSGKDKQEAIAAFNHFSLTVSGIPVKIQVFENQDLPTDLQICIYWDKTGDHVLKKAFGETLASAFKAYGWISHSIWEPLKETI